MPEIDPADVEVTSATTDGSADDAAQDATTAEPEPDTTGRQDDGSSDVTAPVGSIKFEDLPPETQREVRKLRAEARDASAKARDQVAAKAREDALAEAEQARVKAVEDAKAEAVKALQKALGLSQDEADELTPDQVIDKITRERDEEKAAREQERTERLELLREVAVTDAANRHDVDPSKLLDSRSFMRTIEGLDAADKDAFRVAVMDAVEKAAEETPSLKTQRKATPPPASSGTTVAGSKTRSVDDMSVEELIAAGFTKRR